MVDYVKRMSDGNSNYTDNEQIKKLQEDKLDEFRQSVKKI